MPPEFQISTDKTRLDLPWVCIELRHQYWGGWLNDEQIRSAIAYSLCFGLYHNTTQVGFARVVTDSHIFSSVMDVVITQPLRRRGLGTMLMQAVVEHPSVANTISILNSRDMFPFYTRFGYKPYAGIMRRVPTINMHLHDFD